MCSATFLIAIDRIFKLLMELVRAEMKTWALGVDMSEVRVGSRSGNMKAVCSYLLSQEGS